VKWGAALAPTILSLLALTHFLKMCSHLSWSMRQLSPARDDTLR
jgi:hypothetical protein